MKNNTSYEKIFDKRGHTYNRAHVLCPNAREQERKTLIDLLDLIDTDIVIDAPAGGGYVADAIHDKVKKVICIEPSTQFASVMPTYYEIINCPIYKTPIESSCATKYSSLAGLHHLNEHELNRTFSEAHRLIKQGGKCVIADVKKGSLQDAFLNGPVDRYTITGHNGRFFEEGELSYFLEKSGFSSITEEFHVINWSFQSESTMYTFVKNLFGLIKASDSDIKSIVNDSLKIKTNEGECVLEWGLTYATGIR